MAKRVTVRCTSCGAIIEMEARSLRRWQKKHESTNYICQRCTNVKIAKSRFISEQERMERSERAKAQWEDEQTREKMVNGLKKAGKKPKFKAVVSKNMKRRWEDPAYRSKMEQILRDKASPKKPPHPGD